MNFKRETIQLGWILSGVLCVVLFTAAMQLKGDKLCKGIKVSIDGIGGLMLVDENKIIEIIGGREAMEHRHIVDIDTRVLEAEIEKSPWVKKADLFFDNKQQLCINISERQPVARVFTLNGGSFYVDSGAVRLPPSSRISLRVATFTNFPSERDGLSTPDSLLLRNVVKIGQFLQSDSFWNAQIGQVYITPQATFELIPTIGNHTIILGDATDIEEKFARLYVFYKQAWLQSGINKYSKLDIQYKNQVVAVKSGIVSAVADTAKARAAINALMNGTIVVSEDSTDFVAIGGGDTLIAKPIIPTRLGAKKAIKKNKSKKITPLNNKVPKKPLLIVRKSKPPLKKAKKAEKKPV